VVRLAEHTQGFIPNIFWADVQLRNPAKRFKEDETLTAMVRHRVPGPWPGPLVSDRGADRPLCGGAWFRW